MSMTPRQRQEMARYVRRVERYDRELTAAYDRMRATLPMYYLPAHVHGFVESSARATDDLSRGARDVRLRADDALRRDRES